MVWSPHNYVAQIWERFIHFGRDLWRCMMTFVSFTVSENEKQNMKLMHKYLKLVETEKPCFVADLFGNGRDRVKGLGLPDIVLSGYGLLQIVYSCKYTESVAANIQAWYTLWCCYHIITLCSCRTVAQQSLKQFYGLKIYIAYIVNVLQHHNGYTVILE